jgi:quinol-cytochrome oxidoreductase complex cytochrome b subunit
VSFLERVDESIRRSAAWRAIFRQPYPADERSRAMAVMNNVFLHLHPVRVRQHAVKFAYTFCLGGLSFFLFLVLVITGVYLMFFYVPYTGQAYTNILNIDSSVVFGQLTRNIHRWAAHLMVFFVFLHMMRVFYHGAYKPPREFNWVVGVVLLLLTLLLSFTGYLLPWDQTAYWATVVGINLNGTAPFLGPWLAQFLRGGQEIGAGTLTRFYSLHMLVIPGGIIALITLHLYLVIRLGVTSPPWSKEAAGMEEVDEEPARLRPGLTRPVPRPSGASAMQAEPGGSE